MPRTGEVGSRPVTHLEVWVLPALVLREDGVGTGGAGDMGLLGFGE